MMKKIILFLIISLFCGFSRFSNSAQAHTQTGGITYGDLIPLKTKMPETKGLLLFENHPESGVSDFFSIMQTGFDWQGQNFGNSFSMMEEQGDNNDEPEPIKFKIAGSFRWSPEGPFGGNACPHEDSSGYLEFELWNVGALAGEEYAKGEVQGWLECWVVISGVPQCAPCREEGRFEQYEVIGARFSGGPNGIISLVDDRGIHKVAKFENGTRLIWLCEDSRYCFSGETSVPDTTIFQGWTDSGYSESTVTEPEAEITREHIKTTYGIDVWDSFGDDGYDRAVWSDQELTWLNDVLKELPPELIDRMAVNRIVRNTVDIDEDGNPMPSTFGVYEPCDISVDPHCDGSSATIRIFDHAKSPFDFLNDPDGEKQFKATILHEMVHGMQYHKGRHSIYVNDNSPLVENYIDATRQITDMEAPGFNGWNGWNWDGRRWRYTNDSSNQPPTNYGLTDPLEDMAESVMMYVYDPERLKNSSYERYYFIRDEMFGGVEYEDGVQKKP